MVGYDYTAAGRDMGVEINSRFKKALEDDQFQLIGTLSAQLTDMDTQEEEAKFIVGQYLSLITREKSALTPQVDEARAEALAASNNLRALEDEVDGDPLGKGRDPAYTMAIDDALENSKLARMKVAKIEERLIYLDKFLAPETEVDADESAWDQLRARFRNLGM